MLCINDLLELKLFQHLPHHRLEWVCDRAREVELSNGDILVREGDVGQGFFILSKGSLSITRLSEGMDIPIGQHDAPSFFGEIQSLTDELVPVTLRAIAPCRLHVLTDEDFRELLHECRDFERIVFQTMQQRMQGLTSFIRQREKMAALGTLAAGLAHEMNNPAAAVVRALQDVIPALIELQRMNLVAGRNQVDEEHTQEWLKARDDGYDAILNDRLDSLDLGDREEALLDWLEDYGVDDAWKLSEPLAVGGVEVATLERLMERWRNDTTEMRDMGLRWLALSFDVMTMIASGLRGAKRMSELVGAMKSYTHMDRGVQQIIDIHEGLEDTLRLFDYKLKKGIEIHRAYDCQLPKLLAYGSELNQVWTILIDNAIDAIPDKGAIAIATTCDSVTIRVDITDSGAGIPADIQSRIFEPFFTTKPVGKGSGLGLETARRIVENRHRGTLTFESIPGKTQFTVCLPISSNYAERV